MSQRKKTHCTCQCFHFATMSKQLYIKKYFKTLPGQGQSQQSQYRETDSQPGQEQIDSNPNQTDSSLLDHNNNNKADQDGANGKIISLLYLVWKRVVLWTLNTCSYEPIATIPSPFPFFCLHFPYLYKGPKTDRKMPRLGRAMPNFFSKIAQWHPYPPISW